MCDASIPPHFLSARFYSIFSLCKIGIFGPAESAAPINSRLVDIVLSSNLIDPDACLLASGFDYLWPMCIHRIGNLEQMANLNALTRAQS